MSEPKVKCPQCEKELPARYLGVHRARAHGWRAPAAAGKSATRKPLSPSAVRPLRKPRGQVTQGELPPAGADPIAQAAAALGQAIVGLVNAAVARALAATGGAVAAALGQAAPPAPAAAALTTMQQLRGQLIKAKAEGNSWLAAKIVKQMQRLDQDNAFVPPTDTLTSQPEDSAKY